MDSFYTICNALADIIWKLCAIVESWYRVQSVTSQHFVGMETGSQPFLAADGSAIIIVANNNKYPAPTHCLNLKPGARISCLEPSLCYNKNNDIITSVLYAPWWRLGKHSIIQHCRLMRTLTDERTVKSCEDDFQFPSGCWLGIWTGIRKLRLQQPEILPIYDQYDVT